MNRHSKIKLCVAGFFRNTFFLLAPVQAHFLLLRFLIPGDEPFPASSGHSLQDTHPGSTMEEESQPQPALPHFSSEQTG